MLKHNKEAYEMELTGKFLRTHVCTGPTKRHPHIRDMTPFKTWVMVENRLFANIAPFLMHTISPMGKNS